MMQKFFANTVIFIAVGSLGLSASVLPSQAQSEQTRKSCETAIVDGKGRIERGRDITVRTDITDWSEIYSNPPNGRPLSVTIGVGGDAASSVMESPVFQKAIASDIIKYCSSVGSVTFHMRESDWAVTSGIMPDGTIQDFECTDPAPEGQKPRWGQQSCP
jgi:hypothetical protein